MVPRSHRERWRWRWRIGERCPRIVGGDLGIVGAEWAGEPGAISDTHFPQDRKPCQDANRPRWHRTMRTMRTMHPQISGSMAWHAMLRETRLLGNSQPRLIWERNMSPTILESSNRCATQLLSQNEELLEPRPGRITRHECETTERQRPHGSLRGGGALCVYAD